MTIWTDDRVELLKKKCDLKLPASQIAKELGCFDHTRDGGRSAVVGKVFRLGLSLSYTVSDPGSRPPKKTRARPQYHVNALMIQRLQMEAVQQSPEPEAPREQTDTATLAPTEHEQPDNFLGISLFDLEPEHCRYPRGEGANILFCGQPKTSGSYCTACYARCHYTAPAKPGPA